MNLPDNDFSQLKKLLVCKRYEQPPPRYFSSFSDKVVARLEAEELIEYSSWWQWLVDKFDAKPIVACVYGCVVSGLLLAGFRLSQVFENEASVNPLAGGTWLGLATTQGSNGVLPGELEQPNVLEPSTSSYSLSGTAGSFFRSGAANRLFEGNTLRLQPLSFSAAGN